MELIFMLGKLAILNSFFIQGLHRSSKDPFILHVVSKKLSSLPVVIYDPIIGCVYCMASVWGVVWFSSVNLFLLDCGISWLVIPFYIATLGGINWFVTYLFTLMSSISTKLQL